MGGPSPEYRDRQRFADLNFDRSGSWPRHVYEGNGGWKDGRLGQAYDLIDAVMKDHPEVAADLRAARDALEVADQEIGEG
jgi:hypothetical protein